MSVFELREGALLLHIRLTPKASRNAISGIINMPNGQEMLKIAVNALPEDGKANTELIRFLSKTLDIPKNRITLVSGTTSREKLVQIQGDIKQIAKTITSLSEDLK